MDAEDVPVIDGQGEGVPPERLEEIREQISLLRPADFEWSADWEIALSAKELLAEVDRTRAADNTGGAS